jgi:cytochrome P450
MNQHVKSPLPSPDFGEAQAAARARAYSMPLEDINVADPALFANYTMWPYFERLRREDPVHYQREHEFGPYWSVTKYNDIVAVDTNHKAFSSEPAITLFNPQEDFRLPMFIAMDPPKHDVQRKTVQPVVAPENLQMLEPIIRERAAKILDSLPIGEEFDWVDKVSIELTTMTLATLFDYPWEKRRDLTYWSDVATAGKGSPHYVSDDHRKDQLRNCLVAFQELWADRVKRPPGNDLVSMLAHGIATKDMPPMEYLGNLVLLIVGGNDTTRNSISGSLYALNKWPAQYDKLRADPSLIPNMVSETIRWQTPLAYMRRTALEDVQLRGKTIKKGDKVAMWYVSGNRDDEVISDPDNFHIDRENARRHISFGFGIHRCVGNRLAELQLKIIWEEIMKRFPRIDMVGEPDRVYSSFVKGYEKMRVVIPKRN